VSIFERDLGRTVANYTPLSPLTFIERAAATFPDRAAVVYGDHRYSWSQTYARARQLASALRTGGVAPGATVAVMLPNVPAMYEAHFGVPMAGAVLHSINTRLDAATVAYMLDHGEAEVLLTDPEFAPVVREALARCSRPIRVIDVADPSFDGGERLGDVEYEAFIAAGDPSFDWSLPADEWNAISLNYTSGTTGDPKGVVYHHRGAYLNAVGNILTWNMGASPVYLWTLPMFHCNGWCFPWTMAAAAGTSVCLRYVRDEAIYAAIRNERVTHLCGAPIVLSLIANADAALKAGVDHAVNIMTAAAPPPPAVLEAISAMGWHVTHTYGLTETYGPAVVCEWNEEWNALPAYEQAEKKARQGVRYLMLERLEVADPDTLEPIAHDESTLGEVMFRGNIVMKGYLKDPQATARAFAGGWFHSGDLGVTHEDGYLEIRDRSKDIIISGGENISSIEVEKTLYRHPAVTEAAVVARPDARWGETPCAFVSLRAGAEVSEQELIAFCRENMAGFKVPKRIVFGELPKTSTGKVQKFVLRQRAEQLDD
jgi:fatty-acyl-CoA synthase